MIDRRVYELCLEHHRNVSGLPFVVPSSIPIPYFGDIKAYENSPLRILTAALNPSDREFPANDRRFNVARGLSGPEYLEAELSAYFKVAPYRRWFSSFEPVLNGLNGSYGGVMSTSSFPSTALHVDLCSPIATSPTWSKLTPEQRSQLTSSGRVIFERLVAELDPDIIIASLGWAHLKGWHPDFEDGRDWELVVIHNTATLGTALRVPLLVQSKPMRWGQGRTHLFVNCSAANTPLGRFTTQRKIEVGELLRARIRGGAA